MDAGEQPQDSLRALPRAGALLLPGGKREWDENDLQCLRREVREELSVELITPSLRYIQTFYGPAPNGLPMKMACYEGGHRGTMKPSNEVEEIAWFTTADKHRTTVVGVMILDWYEVHNKID